MAAFGLSLFSPLVFLLVVAFQHCEGAAKQQQQPLKGCRFNAIYQLGDSISDTGNLIRENPTAVYSQIFSHLPYGQSFFKNESTGRCSNGLLMVDYFAIASGLPLLNPYLKKDAVFVNGVNFPVAGSTAMDSQVLSQKNIKSQVTNSSLNRQLDWMSSHFNSTCTLNQRDLCSQKLKSALFLVGEIGGNDYNYALFQRKTIQELKNMVPEVVQTIKDAVKKVISFGATRIVVPGNFPIGCMPFYLTGFQTNDTTAYDELHCLKGLNDFASYHNDQLKQAIQVLKKENPNVAIVYGDYYNAFLWVLRNSPSLGFEKSSIQKACCGTGGEYNFSMMKICGFSGVPICPDPKKRMSWDGIHFTEQAYKYMANWLIGDILPKLNCNKA